MIARYLLAILIILCPPVFAAETVLDDPDMIVKPQANGSVILIISPAAAKACAEQGGCKIVSRDNLVEWVKSIKPKLCDQRDI